LKKKDSGTATADEIRPEIAVRPFTIRKFQQQLSSYFVNLNPGTGFINTTAGVGE